MGRLDFLERGPQFSSGGEKKAGASRIQSRGTRGVTVQPRRSKSGGRKRRDKSVNPKVPT